MSNDVIIKKFYEHVTIDGERWDKLAALYYGNAYLYEAIIRANPHVAILPYLPAGLKLMIPIIESSELNQTSGEASPWQ